MLAIRTAVSGDLDSLLTLYRHLNSDPPVALLDAERIFSQFSHVPGCAIFVGVFDGGLVSSCTLVVIPNLTRGGRSYALIENVVTDAAYRKRGFGKSVLQAAIDAAWAQDCYKVMLLTGSKNPTTLRFYESVGFVQNKTGFQIRRTPAREESAITRS